MRFEESRMSLASWSSCDFVVELKSIILAAAKHSKYTARCPPHPPYLMRFLVVCLNVDKAPKTVSQAVGPWYLGGNRWGGGIPKCVLVHVMVLHIIFTVSWF